MFARRSNLALLSAFVVVTILAAQWVVPAAGLQTVARAAGPTPTPMAGELPDMSGVAFKNPDTLTDALIGEPESLDPAWTYETTGATTEMNIYEGPTFYDREKATEFIPALADKWEISKDGLTYVFHFRQGVSFHEGGTVEAHDFAYSLQRGMLQDRVDGPQWLFLTPFFGVGTIKDLVDQVGDLKSEDFSALDLNTVDPKVLAGTCEAVKKAVAFDDKARTVTLALKSPAPWLLQLLSSSYGATFSQDWMVKNGDWDGDCATWQKWNNPAAEKSQLFEKANGTGPYKLDHWTHGDEIVLVANDKYWRTEPMWADGPSGPPKIKRIVFKLVSEWGTRLAMFQAGDIDTGDVERGFITQIDPMVTTAYEGIDSKAPATSINPKGSLTLYKGYPTPRADIGIFTFNINTEGGNPFIGSGELDGNGITGDFFSDIHARKAFNYCFDWESFIRDALSGEAVQARGPIIPDMMGYDPESQVFAFDKDKCAEEFKAAWGGQVWEKGFYMQIAYNTGNTVRQMVGDILKANIEAVHPDGKFSLAVVNIPWPAFLDARSASRLPLLVAGWQEDYHDPSNWVAPYMDCKSGSYSRAQKLPADLCAKWTDLITKAVDTTDQTQRETLYKQLQQEYYDSAAGIPLESNTGRRYVQKWIYGFYYNPLYPEPMAWIYGLSKSQ